MVRRLFVVEKGRVQQEGVIQFRVEHEECRLSSARYGAIASTLAAWRRVFVQTGLLGATPARYGGLGFGNLSMRVGAPSVARGRRRFLVTGSQTGRLSELSLDDCALVQEYSMRGNSVVSTGRRLPSSESITHGALYDQSPAIRCVFHVHAQDIWREARRLRLPASRPSVAYGTPEMADEVARLLRETALLESRIMVMGGHEDGVIGFGRDAQEAGQAILAALVRAYESNS